MAEPVSTVFSALAIACELNPRRRASFWSITMRTCRVGSIQSKLTFSAFGFAATDAASFEAISRTSEISGPLTRYWTGQPTGGPSSSG